MHCIFHFVLVRIGYKAPSISTSTNFLQPKPRSLLDFHQDIRRQISSLQTIEADTPIQFNFQLRRTHGLNFTVNVYLLLYYGNKVFLEKNNLQIDRDDGDSIVNETNFSLQLTSLKLAYDVIV